MALSRKLRHLRILAAKIIIATRVHTHSKEAANAASFFCANKDRVHHSNPGLISCLANFGMGEYFGDIVDAIIL